MVSEGFGRRLGCLLWEARAEEERDEVKSEAAGASEAKSKGKQGANEGKRG